MLTALFDRKFDHLISRQALGIVYAVVVAAHLLGCLVGMIWLAAFGGFAVFLGIVGGLVCALVGLLLIRLAFEAVAVYFRAAEDLRAIRDAGASTLD